MPEGWYSPWQWAATIALLLAIYVWPARSRSAVASFLQWIVGKDGFFFAAIKIAFVLVFGPVAFLFIGLTTIRNHVTAMQARKGQLPYALWLFGMTYAIARVIVDSLWLAVAGPFIFAREIARASLQAKRCPPA